LREYQSLLDVFMSALVDKGVVTAEQIERQRVFLAGRGAWNGARIVARAWVDPKFKQALLTRGREAVRELNIPPGKLGKLGVAENTATLHNVVVCTLCSCYPHDMLGDPPWWYRDDRYKKSIVRDPRATLADQFKLRLPDGVEVRVHDSTSDVRWMVLPRRPDGTEAWSEEQLAALVTIDSMVGTARLSTQRRLFRASAESGIENERGRAHASLSRRQLRASSTREPERQSAHAKLHTWQARHHHHATWQHPQSAGSPRRIPAAVQCVVPGRRGVWRRQPGYAVSRLARGLASGCRGFRAGSLGRLVSRDNATTRITAHNQRAAR